jgi:PTH2 family peptidyl-tRNA hydrolase
MNTKMVIVVRKDLNMRKGKIAAQAAHAANAFLTRQLESAANKNIYRTSLTQSVSLSSYEIQWIAESNAKIVVGVNSESELRELIECARKLRIPTNQIIDAGKTEFNGVPTLTCAAFGPYSCEELDKVTGHLSLL